jgi:hypothetical protein
MKDLKLFNDFAKSIEAAALSLKEIQTVLRLLAARFPKPKKLAKPKVAKPEVAKTVSKSKVGK